MDTSSERLPVGVSWECEGVSEGEGEEVEVWGCEGVGGLRQSRPGLEDVVTPCATMAGTDVREGGGRGEGGREVRGWGSEQFDTGNTASDNADYLNKAHPTYATTTYESVSSVNSLSLRVTTCDTTTRGVTYLLHQGAGCACVWPGTRSI